MIEWLGYAAAWMAFAMVRLLGPVAASNLGGALGRWIGPMLSVSRVADANLRMALPELDGVARRRVIRGVWDNLGRTVAELPHVPNLRRTEAGPGWEIEGEEHVRPLIAAGRPVLLFGAHIGNWEILPLASAQLGLPFASFYRAASNPRLDTLITRLRTDANGGVPLFAKGAKGGRDALAYVRDGGSLGFVIDQKMNDGVEATFFGRPAMTAGALASIALVHGCAVLGGHTVRLGPARFRVIADPPLDVALSGDRKTDILAITQAVNDSVEGWVRAQPESWLWLHRRWKVTEGSHEPARQEAA